MTVDHAHYIQMKQLHIIKYNVMYIIIVLPQTWALECAQLGDVGHDFLGSTTDMKTVGP